MIYKQPEIAQYPQKGTLKTGCTFIDNRTWRNPKLCDFSEHKIPHIKPGFKLYLSNEVNTRLEKTR